MKINEYVNQELRNMGYEGEIATLIEYDYLKRGDLVRKVTRKIARQSILEELIQKNISENIPATLLTRYEECSRGLLRSAWALVEYLGILDTGNIILETEDGRPDLNRIMAFHKIACYALEMSNALLSFPKL